MTKLEKIQARIKESSPAESGPYAVMEDADFIDAARKDILWLLERIEELRKVAIQAECQLDYAARCLDPHCQHHWTAKCVPRGFRRDAKLAGDALAGLMEK